VLESALAAFPGTIVFIRTTAYFINRIATSIVEITTGSLVVHQGNYDDYLDTASRPMPRVRRGGRRQCRGHPGFETTLVRESPGTAAGRPGDPARACFGESGEEVGRVEGRAGAAAAAQDVERQIHALEARLVEIGERLGDPALYADGERGARGGGGAQARRGASGVAHARVGGAVDRARGA